MKIVLIFILGLTSLNAHYYHAPVARPRKVPLVHSKPRPYGPPPRVRVVERRYPNQNEVLPQFVDEVEQDDQHYAVCGVNGQTYASRARCPVKVAHVGKCRPRYAYDTYWYMPHGWELYQPDGKPRRSRDLYGYHQHVMPPYFHA